MKLFIKNRKGQKICVLIDKTENQKGLVFLMHGLSGNKDQAHIQTFSKVFLDNNYTVIRFDTTNTFGESEGNYEDATVTNYYEDLEDVINWVKTQEFYQEPFVLVGHSMGGMCVTLFAQKFPEKIKALAPISTTISGELSVKRDPEKMKKWKKTGWHIEKTPTRGIVTKLPWSHMEDRMKYDILTEAEKLDIPVLIIVGEKDRHPEYQKLLFDKLSGRKELHIINGAPHDFKEDKHLTEVSHIFDKWLKGLDK